jgi:hypothetical protein
MSQPLFAKSNYICFKLKHNLFSSPRETLSVLGPPTLHYTLQKFGPQNDTSYMTLNDIKNVITGCLLFAHFE